MCLDRSKIQKFEKPKNWVEGYKILRRSTNGGKWRSQYSQQNWEFAELVKATAPGTTHFSGVTSYDYKKGIHAWTSLEKGKQLLDPDFRIVKVLLFGVTHHDQEAYRADAAIIIEALNKQGYRERW